MYIWVVLLTFIVTLYSFNLHYRADVRDIRVAPLAEAVIAKVETQHRAVKQYAQINKDVISMKLNDSGDIVKEDTEGGALKGLANMTVYGYNFDDNVKSKFFCVDANSPHDAKPCNSTDIYGYFATYMQIPRRWANEKTGEPSSELLRAFSRKENKISSLGYNVQKRTTLPEPPAGTVNTGWEILSEGPIRVFIPNSIINDADFNKTCTKGIACIVYISSEYKN